MSHYLDIFMKEQTNTSSRGGAQVLGEAELEFVARRDSFYLATVNAEGWPYVQHRGGPAGFLAALDSRTLAFADVRGNRQLISTGNLSTHDRVSLILVDYPRRERLKIAGHARVFEASERPELVERLAPVSSKRVERIFEIEVVAFDWNCPQNITPRYTVAEIEEATLPLRQKIAELEGEVARLRRSS